MYADDIKLYRSFVDNEDRSGMQSAIDKIHEWSKIWQLPLSPGKCQFIQLGRKCPADYFIGPTRIEQVSCVRDLGFQINEKLTPSDHVALIAKKASTKMHILLRATSTRNRDALRTLYTTFVRPILEYGTTIWSPYPEKDKLLLEKIQNRMTRIISHRCDGVSFEHRPSAADRNKSLNLTTLSYRRRVRDMTILYQILLGAAHISNLCSKLFVFTPSHSRGSQFILHVRSQPRKRNAHQSYAHRVSRVMNRILHNKKFPMPYSEYMSIVRQNTNWE